MFLGVRRVTSARVVIGRGAKWSNEFAGAQQSTPSATRVAEVVRSRSLRQLRKTLRENRMGLGAADCYVDLPAA